MALGWWHLWPPQRKAVLKLALWGYGGVLPQEPVITRVRALPVLATPGCGSWPYPHLTKFPGVAWLLHSISGNCYRTHRALSCGLHFAERLRAPLKPVIRHPGSQDRGSVLGRERSGPGLPFGADGYWEERPGPSLCPNNGNCVGRTGRPAAGEEIGS